MNGSASMPFCFPFGPTPFAPLPFPGLLEAVAAGPVPGFARLQPMGMPAHLIPIYMQTIMRSLLPHNPQLQMGIPGMLQKIPSLDAMQTPVKVKNEPAAANELPKTPPGAAEEDRAPDDVVTMFPRIVTGSASARKASTSPSSSKAASPRQKNTKAAASPSAHCQCRFCGKIFTRHWLLQGHMRTHTGEKPFQCAHCPKSFADKSNLRAHEQTHSGLKPHECTRCGKRFALKSYLSKHEESACQKMARI